MRISPLIRAAAAATLIGAVAPPGGHTTTPPGGRSAVLSSGHAAVLESGRAAATRPVFGDRTFVEAVKRIRPAVVHIRVKLPKSAGSGLMGFFGRGPKREPSLDFGESDLRGSAQVGAGVIISKEGYILTNQHIIKDAAEIFVKLHTGEEFTARVSGADEKSDLALIRIETKGKLTPAALGDSDAVEIGEWVIAVGSPFGLAHSVSVGIISAKGRDLNQGPYDSYLQTDASINPGNSGGPLANSRGEVIGINTAIFTRGRRYKSQGVGFAVPINQAKAVLDDLRHKGYPIRGRLGVSVGEVPAKEGKKIGLTRYQGARLAHVVRGSPADKAGLRRGDVIVEFGGKTVVTWQTLPRVVARARPGEETEVKYYRGGELKTLRVRIGRRPDRPGKLRSQIRNALGMRVEEITPRLASRFRLEAKRGLIVTAVKAGGPAERGGVRAGDEIIEVNHTAVSTRAEFDKIIRRAEGTSSEVEGSALLLLRRGGSDLFAAVRFSR